MEGWKRLNPKNPLEISDEALDVLQDVLYENSMIAYWMGRYNVHRRATRTMIERGLKDWADGVALADAVQDAWNLRFERGVEWFRTRVPIDPDEYYKLAEEVRHKYFSVSRVEGKDMIAKIRDEAARAVEEGRTEREFREALDELFDRMGVTRLNSWHIDTVFRANLGIAYQAGQYEQIMDPSMKAFFPLLEYVAIMDDVTRPAHRAMDGFIARRDDPVWDKWFPPNGFGCRCDVSPVSSYEVEEKGIQPSRGGVPKLPGTGKRAWPDEGWAFTPSDALRSVPESVEKRLQE